MSTVTAAADVPILIVSDNSQSERRISPSWTIEHLRTRLEPITGIPASSQKLALKVGTWPLQSLDVSGGTLLSAFPLQQYAEIHVQDTRPAGLRENYTDLSAVQKYEMPPEEYENRTDSVLAWKKNQKLGRFDPNAPSIEQQKIRAIQRELDERGIKLGSRCRLLPETDARRGTVSFIGDVAEILGLGAWVGVALDEPTGKNDGSIKGVRYFKCPSSCGVFVRPERVEVGDFQQLDDLEEDEEF